MAKFSKKQGGKEVGSADDYAVPHKPNGAKLEGKDIGFSVDMPTRKNWTPLNGGVSIGVWSDEEKEGIKIRGTGAAETGVMSRGPMA
jgi:hypothetical protein